MVGHHLRRWPNIGLTICVWLESLNSGHHTTVFVFDFMNPAELPIGVSGVRGGETLVDLMMLINKLRAGTENQ